MLNIEDTGKDQYCCADHFREEDLVGGPARPRVRRDAIPVFGLPSVVNFITCNILNDRMSASLLESSTLFDHILRFYTN